MIQSASRPPLLEVREVTKRFPGVQALTRVRLTLHAGEVVALIGENGAGKSTLMKILAGVQQPDEGQIRIDGSPVEIASVHAALSRGISLIHQELNLSDNLDVGANLFLGREPRRLGFIDRATIRRESRRVLALVGLQVDPDTVASTLSIGQQQLVEIAKALSTNARVLIMDEPTSSLSQHETEQLFRVIHDLRQRGVCIVYISHRLGEVKYLADRVVALRDGENAGELSRDEISHHAMVKLMVGRDIAQFYSRRPHESGSTVLSVRGLRTLAHPEHALTFSVRAGEMVGIAGLIGAGRTELLRTLFGVDLPAGGEMRLGGELVRFQDPRDAIRAGIALAPEDRKLQGLVLDFSVRQNVSLPGLYRHRRLGAWLNFGRERADTFEMIQRLGIKTPHADQVVQYLSGGNQQKVVLGKWLALKPRLLLLDEPTRGIDVGAKQEIYALVESLAEQGVAILFASSEMEEILGMSDRVLVMHEGRLAGQLNRHELTEEAVMQLAVNAVVPRNTPPSFYTADE
ncbi:MAG: sugar ABC transporter ATP-binding protein [Pirellulaceae bacterium]